MFIVQLEQGVGWDDSGINGISRWLNRVWNLALAEAATGGQQRVDPEAENQLRRQTHKTVKKVAEDIEKFRFNTMLAALMEFTNYLTKVKEGGEVGEGLWGQAIDTLLLLLAPSAPHLAEELWERNGRPYSIHNQPFPTWDEALVEEESIDLVIQVNGKLRDRVAVPATISEAAARELALSNKRVRAHLDGKEIKKVIYVPGRLVNIVVG